MIKGGERKQELQKVRCNVLLNVILVPATTYVSVSSLSHTLTVGVGLAVCGFLGQTSNLGSWQ
jgi:hypothetical protein